MSSAKNLNCICVNVQEKDFDLLTELKDIESKKGIMGAVVTFTGQVRLFEKGEEILSLDLEHYPGMTEKKIFSICENASKKWKIPYVKVIHRVGRLYPGQNIVLVIVASPHRKPAFKAAEYIMDFLKSRVPIWKKANFPKRKEWVESKEEDENLIYES